MTLDEALDKVLDLLQYAARNFPAVDYKAWKGQLRAILDELCVEAHKTGFAKGRRLGFAECEEQASETLGDVYQSEPMVNR